MLKKWRTYDYIPIEDTFGFPAVRAEFEFSQVSDRVLLSALQQCWGDARVAPYRTGCLPQDAYHTCPFVRRLLSRVPGMVFARHSI